MKIVTMAALSILFLFAENLIYAQVRNGLTIGTIENTDTMFYSQISTKVQTNLDSALVAYYPFDGNVNDESGNGFNGDITGHSPTLTTDRFGNANSAYDFDGMDDYIYIPSAGNLSFDASTQSYTISTWIYIDSLGNATGYDSNIIFDREIGTNSWTSYHQSVITQELNPNKNRVYSSIWNGLNTTYGVFSTVTIEAKRWYNFITVVTVGQSISLYIDGQLDSSISIVGITNTKGNTGGITIGGGWYNDTGLQLFNGVIDDIRIYNVALTGTAIDSLFHEGGFFIPNDPPIVLNPIIDIVADEDFGSIMVALLDTVFDDPDLPNDSLRYTVSVSSGLITATVAGDSLWLFSVGHQNGMAEVVVTATDDSSASVSDTFNITVLPDTISPNLSFSSDTLDFSTVFVGYTASKQLIIMNLGIDSLFISDISSDNGVFTADVSSSDLGGGGRDTLSVTFSPVSAGSFTGELTFTSNDHRDSLKTVHLTGNSLIAPVISVSPDSIDEVLVVGDSADHVVTIDNSAGGSELSWEAFTFQAGGAFVINSSPIFVNKGEPLKSKIGDKFNSVKTPQSLIYRSENTADILPRVIENISSGADERSLEFILDHLNLNFEQVTDAIPLIFNFSDGVVGYDINDGGNDMYDGGNIISTDLGGPIDYSDDLIIDHAAFGDGGRYFTRKHPGLFVLAADIDSISNFDINGNNGADGYGSADGAILQLNKAGVIYNGFVKRVFAGDGDPSINHLIIVEQLPDVDHEFSFDTNDDYHRVFNLEANTRLYYLLYAGAGGSYINNETTLRIMDAFLEAVDPLRWIRLTPESGIVAAGASTTMEVFLDGRLLSPGDHEADIEIISNDPLSEKNTIPVILKVLPPPIGPPEILSIDDVPDDQGGWVTVLWKASKDDDFFSDTPVSFYSIWLRNNSPNGVAFDENEVLLRRVEKGGSDGMTVVTEELHVGEKNLENADVKSLELLNMAVDIENEITMPARLNRVMSDGGSWIGIGTIGATQDSIYEFLVHTLADSNDTGLNWSYLKISAHPHNPFTYSESEVDSGYSVDNKRPATPSNLGVRAIGGALEVYWRGIEDEDFDYYAIYKSRESGFDPSSEEYFGVTTDTLFTDSEVGGDTIYYYVLSAFDFNGNESEYSPEINASLVGTEDEIILPDEYLLGQNFPNPFNPQTTISFALPTAGNISLIIYDLNGREIMRWDEDISQGGYYQKVWNGENLSGEQVSSGVYLYRFRAGDFVQTKKMVLLR